MTTRNDEDERVLAAVREATAPMRLSVDARTRIERRLQGGAAGATTLRGVEHAWPRRTAWALGACAAVLLAVMWALPTIDRETTISAAEVLGRSQQALAAPAAGVEIMTYDLMLGGILDDLLPAGQAGAFTVQETVDHDHPGRYKLVKIAPDGRVMFGIADDSLTRTRARYVLLDNRGFLLRFAETPAAPMSVIGLKRAALQALIGMMQASDKQMLREVEHGGEPAYEVDVPGVSTNSAGLVTLERARMVVRRADARLLDFDAQGTMAGRSFAVTFSLRTREMRAAGAMPPGTFTIEPAPGDYVLDAKGASPAPLWDVLEQCLRR